MTQRGMPSSTGRGRTVYQVSNELYGMAFDGETAEQVGAAMRDFKELPETDREYVHCHLSYLHLHAQQVTQALLTRLLELLNFNTGAVHAIAGSQLRQESRDRTTVEPMGGPGGGAVDAAVLEAIRSGYVAPSVAPQGGPGQGAAVTAPATGSGALASSSAEG